MRNFLSFVLQNSCQNDEIKNEMGESCRASGGDNKCFKPQLEHAGHKRNLEGVPEGMEQRIRFSWLRMRSYGGSVQTVMNIWFLY